MKKIFSVLLATLVSVSCVSKSKSYFGNALDKAVQTFQAQKTPMSLFQVQTLLAGSLGNSDSNLQVLHTFEILFQYYTEEQKDFASGQMYFEELFANKNLNESQELDLQERIAVLKEWRAMRKDAPPVTIFDLSRYAKLSAGAKDVQFKWSENFYLKEIIRRYPGSRESAKAYTALASNVKIGYPGDDMNAIPPSLMEMLLSYEILASAKK